jgi:hypothetical protein
MMNEELISAYLDGELTAQEQAQVEHALASDARLRQLHDDLRALRQRLQAMPQQKLGADFAERVLRAAVERANASDQAVAASVTTPQHEPEVLLKSHHGDATVVERAQHEPLAWRVMVWSIAGLAAAIAFVLMLPEPTSRVAEVGKNTVVQDNKEGERTSTFTDNLKTTATPSVPAPANGVVAEGKGGARDGAHQGTGRYDFANKDKNLKELNRADETDKSKETLREGAKQGGGDLLQQEPKAAAVRGAVPGASRGGGGAGAVAPALDQTKKTSDGERSIHAKSAFAADAVRQSGVVGELDEAAKATDDVLVVRLEVSPEQFKARGIDAVLAKQSIYFNDQNGRALANEKAEGLDKKRAEEKVRDKTEEQRHAQADRKAENKLVQEAEQLARMGDVDVVYVEASLEQVEAAVAELSDKLGKGVTLGRLAEDHFEDFDRQAPRVRRNAVATAPTVPAEKDEGRGDDAGAAGGGLGAAGKEAEATRTGGEGLARKRDGAFARRIDGNVRAQSFSEEAAAPGATPKPGIAKADLAAGNVAPADAPPLPAPVLSDAAAQEKPTADDRSEFGAKAKQQATKRVRVLFVIRAKADEK